MMELLSDPAVWMSFATLAFLEIVLGIDNIVFVSILASRLPPEQQAKARQIGISCALIFRLLMLFSIAWIIGLTAEAFSLFGASFSWKDLVLLAGGIFLIGKATWEIHNQMEGHQSEGGAVAMSFGAVVAQIAVVDMVFSLDSIITAVGMTPHIPVMVAAVLVAIAVMILAAKPVSEFVLRHPTTKMLALAFLILIGMALVAEGFGHKIPKGYLYFAIAFSLGVEVLNLLYARARGKAPKAPKAAS
jgi:predicted tellurium resistance membrane protein TerC